ncbi:MAG: cation:proton antiporter [Anaerolineales bacterium]|nr:cation:proton antiporter [Anaerolineales bacterium]
MQGLTYLVGFIFIAIASKQIGKLFSALRLPYITGYLFAGMLAGPFLLEFLPKGATDDLRFIDELSLAVIAFVAGSELYLKELQGRLRVIGYNTLGILVANLALSGIALFFLTNFMDFAEGMSVAQRVAVAILGSTILLALSPPSTIAVIKEVRAKGPFTRTLLGITVSMDVVIIVFFAVSAAIASALLDSVGFNIQFVLLLLIDLGAAVLAGYGVGKLLTLILAQKLHPYAKTAIILALGFAIFWLSFQIVEISHDRLPFEIHIEPLLVAMIGGFMITNFSTYRDEFAAILHDVGPLVYVAFFTLTGISLKLDVLLASLPIAVTLFAVRAGGIFLGSYGAGTLLREPANFNRIMWLGLITQAGIALGLARETAVEFPILGSDFATLIIAVVVLNEVFGPIFLKAALKRVGETHLPEEFATDTQRDAVIFGIEVQSLALARQLKSHQWQVILVDTDAAHVGRSRGSDELDERHIRHATEEALSGILTKHTDAVVALLKDDHLNLQICELAYEKFGIKRLVVRLHDMSLAESFREIGATIVDTTSAMVNLLDQTVRVPQSAALLLHHDPQCEFGQVTMTDSELVGVPLRELRLPTDVLVVSIQRQGQLIVPHGYTQLQLRDEITLVGRPESLQTVTLRLGY